MIGPSEGRTTPYPIAVIKSMKKESELRAALRTATRTRSVLATPGWPVVLR